MTDFSDWIELDLKLKTNKIHLNGFAFGNDSTYNYLNIFKNQKAVDNEIAEILPQTTAYLMHIGLSDFSMYRENLKKYLSKNNKLFEYEQNIRKINNTYSCDIENDLLYWINGDIALSISEF